MKGRPEKGEFLNIVLYPEQFDDCQPWQFPKFIGQQRVAAGTIYQCGYCDRKWELNKTRKRDDHMNVCSGLEWVALTPPAVRKKVI